jgi:hypothetical protein
MERLKIYQLGSFQPYEIQQFNQLLMMFNLLPFYTYYLSVLCRTILFRGLCLSFSQNRPDAGIGHFLPAPTLNINVGTESDISKLLAETTYKYARGYNEYLAKQDIALIDDDDIGFSKKEWKIKKGMDIIVGHWLASDSPPSLTEVNENILEKGLHQRMYYRKIEGQLLICVVGAFEIPAVSSFLAALYPAFIAGFFKLYNVEPIEGKGLRVPEAKFALGVALPIEDIRVKIRRRK